MKVKDEPLAALWFKLWDNTYGRPTNITNIEVVLEWAGKTSNARALGRWYREKGFENETVA
jgi:hypothetical protein